MSKASTPALVAKLQEELRELVLLCRLDAPHVGGRLEDAQLLVTEMVSRWRRSTTLALDSIKAFEDQLTRKSREAEELRRTIQSQVCVVARYRVTSHMRVLPPSRCGRALTTPSGGAMV